MPGSLTFPMVGGFGGIPQETIVGGPTYAPPVECVIFGSIGVLCHCSEIQWNCFNEALKQLQESGELVLASGDKIQEPVFWEKEPYVASLTSTGGAKRLKAFFKEYMGVVGDVSDEMCAKIHAKKSELFVDYIEKKGLTLRPGIMALLNACKEKKIKVGLCAVTEHNVLDAFLDTLKLRDCFDHHITDLDRPKFENRGKPEPDCYLYVTKALLGEDYVNEQEKKVKKGSRVIAFEDTWISMCSSVSAGIPTVALPSEWAVGQDFSASVCRVAELPDLVKIYDSSDENVNKIETATDGTEKKDNDVPAMQEGSKLIHVLSLLAVKHLEAGSMKARAFM